MSYGMSIADRSAVYSESVRFFSLFRDKGETGHGQGDFNRLLKNSRNITARSVFRDAAIPKLVIHIDRPAIVSLAKMAKTLL